jgi:glutamyl-tRNA synthetase
MQDIKRRDILSEKVRVRFAPSPTGYLHIGGARTALFNWLYARHEDGTFILRIEDTDRTRSTEEYIEEIIRGLKWLGLDWDEGPYRQTERFDLYKKYVEKLLKEGKAYYCYCSHEMLELKRKEAMKQGKPVRYDRKCREKSEPINGVKPVVRFKMPVEGQTVVEDLIRGRIVFDNSQLDDLIILRSDGTPTYNLTVVVDDVDMRITHVIRGDDHLNNTPKQIQLYRAFGYEVPRFAHLPMILGSDRTRLSKRHGATSVMEYYRMGYLPQALINYLARLGWSYGDQEIFSRDELIRYFSFENVGKAAAVFNPEKLLWINGQYIMSTPSDKLVGLVIPFLYERNILGKDDLIDKIWLARTVDILKERSKTLIELVESLRYFIAEDVAYEEKAREKFLNEKTRELLVEIKERLASVEVFSASEIEKVFRSVVENRKMKLGEVAQPVRVAVTGGTKSPGIFELLEILGRQKTLKRLERAIGNIG